MREFQHSLDFSTEVTRYGKTDVLESTLVVNNYFKSQNDSSFGKEKGFMIWNRAPGRSSGVVDNVILLYLDQDFNYVFLVILY